MSSPLIPIESTVEVEPSQPIKKAAVIDDAFDDVMEGEISFSTFREFMQVSNEENKLEAALTKLNVTFPNVTGWDDDSQEYIEFLKVLWMNRNDSDLEPLVNIPELFAAKISKLEQVEELCRNIEEQNIEIQKFASTLSDLTVFEQGEFVYIFIDYRLGTSNDEEAVKRAKKVAQDIYDICPKEKRPVTILMSADPNVDERVKEDFRKEAMLEGVIRFSPKSDLIDKSKISLLMRAYSEEFSSNHQLQEYIRSLIGAAKVAQEEFEKEVTALRIEDYEFIQNSVLQSQQHPLGDYLAWLYGSHWAHLLFKNTDLKEKQAEIDKVISQKLPLHHTVPSEKLSEIFMTALFERDFDQVTYHPWEGMIKLPYLHLGDLFTKAGSKDVYMVVNPQCDLERPKEKNKGQSILLIPGELESLEENLVDVEIKTDYFLFDDKRNRIVWNLRYLKSIPYDKFDEWIQEKEVERKFRLRLPFALDIQQQYTSNMSRVGLPVAPPLSRSITMEVLIKKSDGTVATIMGESKEYAFLPLTREPKENVRLTLKFALDFKAAIIGEHEAMIRLKGTYSEGVPKALDNAIRKMESVLESFDEWFFKYRSFPYPTDKAKPLSDISISSILNSSLDAFKEDKKIATLFLINVITIPRQMEANADQPVGNQEEHGEVTEEDTAADNTEVVQQKEIENLEEENPKKEESEGK
jgi:hypothetical protein